MKAAPVSQCSGRRSEAATEPFPDTGSRVVYTAIVGEVDLLVAPEIVDPGWDYVCFSDEPVSCAPWRWAPVERDQPLSARAARYLKVNATTVLPSAELSLWVDGNIQPLASAQALADRYLAAADLVFHPHPERSCLFDEAVAVIEQGKDAAATVVPQIVRYARAGMPPHAGLQATAAILRRHTASVAGLDAAWWDEISHGSHRDQLSLPYVLHARGQRYAEFDSDVWRGPLFRYRRHDGPNAPVKARRRETAPLAGAAHQASDAATRSQK
ncbi:MAG TPA: glycosyltransferase domain-containing protein [Solirubrobacterales bacterium]|nr:glycosyltransferase domain-containing protein [Solirubrobacterales bacterium]